MRFIGGRWFGLLVLVSLVSACVGIPAGLHPVEGFDAQRYLGRWYEIARLENSFETGLEQISALYSLRPDGGVDVLNRGVEVADGEWKEAKGVAYFVGPKDQGRLKVSFFGPFYGAYNVIALDPDYRWALVSGPDRSYLWILARQPQLEQAQLNSIIGKAKAFGFATDRLIFVKHAVQ